MSVAVAQSVAGVDFAGMCLLSMFMYSAFFIPKLSGRGIALDFIPQQFQVSSNLVDLKPRLLPVSPI